MSPFMMFLVFMSTEKSEVIPLDDSIAHDAEALRKLVQEKVKRDATLDEEWTVGESLETIDPSIPAVLIQKKKNSAWGALRVIASHAVLNEVSGPEFSPHISMIIIKPGDTCRIYRTPSIRCFRYSV